MQQLKKLPTAMFMVPVVIIIDLIVKEKAGYTGLYSGCTYGSFN